MIANAIADDRHPIRKWDQRIKEDVLKELTTIQQREQDRAASTHSAAEYLRQCNIAAEHEDSMSITSEMPPAQTAKPERKMRDRKKFRIAVSIPLPRLESKRACLIFPFDEMKRGNSILVPASMHTKASNAARMYGKRNKMQFVFKKVKAGTRIWRAK